VLTPATKQMLEFITAYYDEHGLAPTYNEIGEGLGVKTKSDTFRVLQQLERRGYIKREKGVIRGIEILRRHDDGGAEYVRKDLLDQAQQRADRWAERAGTFRELVEGAKRAITAAQDEVEAEFRGHYRGAAKAGQVVQDWRRRAHEALTGGADGP